jgi:hypothetical protein
MQASRTATNGTVALADWVVTRSERGRARRTTHVVVNRRDGNALTLDDEEAERLRTGQLVPEDLERALVDGGFVAGAPPPVPPPNGGRVMRLLSTFDVRWRGAHRWIEWIHAAGLRHAWHRAALAVQAAVALVGVLALVALTRSGRPLELQPSVWEVPVYVGLSLVAITIHELAHGLVVVHHGRRVDAVGFRLHLGSPSCYVESVDALLLGRRQRIVQAAAGPWAEWLVMSSMAVLCLLVPLGPLAAIVHRFVVLGAFTIASNLIPFGGLDGSLILADVVREPDLAHESRRAVGRLRRDRLPGDRFLVAYAIANTAVSGALLVTSLWFWWFLFGGITTTLGRAGPLGWPAAAALLLASFGPMLASAMPAMRRLTIVDRAMFRLERRHRIRLAERFTDVTPFDRLDARALSVLAGQLQLRRVHRLAPLHVAGFRGFLATEQPLLVGASGTSVALGVVPVETCGLAAQCVGRLRTVTIGLLPVESLAAIGVRADERA